MNIGNQWMEVAREIERLIKEGQSYERILRDSGGAEGSIFIVNDAALRPPGVLAARAFEWLLGWPAGVRSAEEFTAYSLPMLRARSVLLAVSAAGEEPVLLDSVRRAGRRGAACLAVTRRAESALARAVRGKLMFAGPGEPAGVPSPGFFEEVALAYISFLVARIYNPRHPQLVALEKGFAELPQQFEWISLQLNDAMASLAARIKTVGNVVFCGGGFYHDAALQSARLAAVKGLASVHADEPSGLVMNRPPGSSRPGAIVLASGSACRTRKAVLALAAKLRERKIALFSITDRNDRELIDTSDLAVVLPPSAELTGALLALACLDWLVLELSS
jgi:DNA-binding MurR/RpiR family transcriptional regulator